MKPYYPGFLDDNAKMELHFMVKHHCIPESLPRVSNSTAVRAFHEFFSTFNIRLIELYATPECNWWLDEFSSKTALPCAAGVDPERGHRYKVTRVTSCTERVEKDVEGTYEDAYVEPPYVSIFTYEDVEQEGRGLRLVAECDEDGNPL